MIAPLSGLVHSFSFYEKLAFPTINPREAHSVRAERASAPRAKRGAASRLRRRAGIPPSAGASAPERASRPEAEGRAGQGEPARGAGATAPATQAPESRTRAAPIIQEFIFCMTYLPYKISAEFCIYWGGRDRRRAQGKPPQRRARAHEEAAQYQSGQHKAGRSGY